jgi:hypothetical protein
LREAGIDFALYGLMRLVKPIAVFAAVALSGCSPSENFTPTYQYTLLAANQRAVEVASTALVNKPPITVNVFADKSPTMAWMDGGMVAGGLQSIADAAASANQTIRINVYSIDRAQLQTLARTFTDINGNNPSLSSPPAPYIQKFVVTPTLFRNTTVLFDPSQTQGDVTQARALLNTQILSGGLVGTGNSVYNTPVGREAMLRVLDKGGQQPVGSKAIFLFISNQDDASTYATSYRSFTDAVSAGVHRPVARVKYDGITFQFKVAQYSTDSNNAVVKNLVPQSYSLLCTPSTVSQGFCPATTQAQGCSDAALQLLTVRYKGEVSSCTLASSLVDGTAYLSASDTVACSGAINISGKPYANMAAYLLASTGAKMSACSVDDSVNYPSVRSYEYMNGPLPAKQTSDAYLNASLNSMLISAYAKPENYMVGAIVHDAGLNQGTGCQTLTRPGEAYGTKYMGLLNQLGTPENAVSICQNDYSKVFTLAKKFVTETMVLTYPLALAAGETVNSVTLRRSGVQVPAGVDSYTVGTDATIQFKPGILKSGDAIQIIVDHPATSIPKTASKN